MTAISASAGPVPIGQRLYPALRAVGLPLLLVLTYTDVSDALMRRFPLPSLVQPLIALLMLVIWYEREQLRPSIAALHPAVLALACYGLLVFSTSVWAIDASLVDARVVEIVKSLLLAILVGTLVSSWQSLKIAFTSLIGAAVVLSLISLVQIATGRFYEAIFGLVSPQSGTIYEHLAMPRAAGPPNSDPNFYARILLITIPLAVALAIVERGMARRALFAGAATLITAGTLVTYSRGAMLALGAMAVLLVVALRVRPRTIAIAGMAAVVVLLLLPRNITQRFLTIEALVPDHDETVVDYDSSVEKRKLLVRSALAMFDAHPFTGVGAGNYGPQYTTYANEVGSSWIDYHPAGTTEHPHGLYFELASETGLPGLLLFLSAVGAILVSLERSRRTLARGGRSDLAILCATVNAAIASYLVASLFLHETHLRYLALYFGFAIAIARLARGERAEAAA